MFTRAYTCYSRHCLFRPQFDNVSRLVENEAAREYDKYATVLKIYIKMRMQRVYTMSVPPPCMCSVTALLFVPTDRARKRKEKDT